MRRHIPNLITLGNLLCGSLAILSCFHSSLGPRVAMWFIVLGAICDLFDGLIARLLHATSPLGADLDSLSDVVTFGLAPALLLISVLEPQLPTGVSLYYLLPFLLLPLCAAYRLARFNHDKTQSRVFKGLPVPANALFWVGAAHWAPQLTWTQTPIVWLLLMYGLIVLFGWLQVSRLRLLAFKVTFPLKTRRDRALLLTGAILLGTTFVLALIWTWVAASLLVVFYVLASLLFSVFIPQESNSDND